MPLEVKDGKLVVKNGLLSTGGCCCGDVPCACSLPFPPGVTVEIECTYELKADPLSNCEPSSDTVLLPLEWRAATPISGAGYYGDGVFGNVYLFGYLFCEGGIFYYSGAISVFNDRVPQPCEFYAIDQDGNVFGSGGGVGGADAVSGVVRNGLCVPNTTPQIVVLPTAEEEAAGIEQGLDFSFRFVFSQ